MPRKGPAPRPRAHARPDLPVGRRHPARQQGAACAGKRSTAEHIVYTALEEIGRKTQGDPVAVLEAGGRERPPAARGQEPPGRWRDLPGAGRGPAPPGDDARDPLDRRLLPPAPGEDHGRAAGRRAHGRQQRHRRRRSSAGKTFRRWRNRTKLLRTTAGKAHRKGTIKT